MVSIEVAVKASRRLESLLEAKFGATGRGLHEKLTSVESRIPEELRRSIRWVATVRNKVVHEDDAGTTDQIDFQRTVDRIVRSLMPERQSPAPARKPIRRTSRTATKVASKASPSRRSKGRSPKAPAKPRIRRASVRARKGGRKGSAGNTTFVRAALFLATLTGLAGLWWWALT